MSWWGVETFVKVGDAARNSCTADTDRDKGTGSLPLARQGHQARIRHGGSRRCPRQRPRRWALSLFLYVFFCLAAVHRSTFQT